MTHARIPDFSQPAPVHSTGARTGRRRLSADGRSLNLPDEPQPGAIEPWQAVTPAPPTPRDDPQPGAIEPWQAVTPARPDTARNRSLRFLDATGELLAAVAIIG